MIRRNKIPGLAPFYEEWENNCWYYGYDITGAQPLFRLLEFRPLTAGEAGLFIDQLAGMLQRLERFLLPGSGLMLQPEYLYLYPDKKQYCFFFCPEKEGTSEEHMRELVWRLVERADEKDDELERLLFRFCRLCARGEIEAGLLSACLEMEPGKRVQAEPGRGIQAETGSEIREETKLWTGTEWEREGGTEAKWEPGRKPGRRSREKPGRKPEQSSGGKPGQESKQKSGRKQGAEQRSDRESIQTEGWSIGKLWKGLFRRSPPGDLWDDLEPEVISEHLRKKAELPPVSRLSFGCPPEIIPMEEGPQTEVLYVEEAAEEYPVLLCRERKEKLVLTKMPFYIGTQPGAQYDPKQKGISRLHAKIEERSGSYWITDLNSTNGTSLDGSLLAPNEERRLVSGSRIGLAGLEYEFMPFDITRES